MDGSRSHARQDALELTAKQQEQYWAKLIHDQSYIRVPCHACRTRKSDENMIYLVTDDIYVCGRFCTKRIRHE